MESEENARKVEAVLMDFGSGGIGLTYQDFLQPDLSYSQATRPTV